MERSAKPDAGRTDWSDEENARRYAEFARTFPMYRDTSSDVVAAAGIESGATVVDLCCGTGVTTEAILEVVGAEGRVIGVDGSAAMLAEASRHVKDARAEFIRSRAEELAAVVPHNVDAVTCNSAIWQTDMPTVFVGVARVLRPGGSFACNIGRDALMLPFTAEELAPHRPRLSELAFAVAVLEHDFAPGMGSRRSPPRTPQSVTDALLSAGLSAAEPQLVEYAVTAEQQRAWLSIPVFSDQVPGRDFEEKMEILDAAFERLGHRNPEGRRWLIFKATKPQD